MARRRNFAIISHPDAGKTTMVSPWTRHHRPDIAKSPHTCMGREREGWRRGRMGEGLACIGDLLACMQVQRRGHRVVAEWVVGLQGPPGRKLWRGPRAAAVYRRRRLSCTAQPGVVLSRCAVQTEKLLLYGGAIHEAGEVKARRCVAEEGMAGHPLASLAGGGRGVRCRTQYGLRPRCPRGHAPATLCLNAQSCVTELRAAAGVSSRVANPRRLPTAWITQGPRRDPPRPHPMLITFPVLYVEPSGEVVQGLQHHTRLPVPFGRESHFQCQRTSRGNANNPPPRPSPAQVLPFRHVRLDGAGAAARHLHHLHRPHLRVLRLPAQPAGHARSPGGWGVC